MLTLVALGILILGALSILCFAAYKIKAREFEFSTVIWKLASFKITIKSPLDMDVNGRRAVSNDAAPEIAAPSANSPEV